MLAALIVVAAIAVRGSLPGAEPPAPDTGPARHPAAAVLVVAMLAVSLALVAVAVLARIRDPRASVGVGAGRPDWYRGPAGRIRWRPILLVLALGVAWLLVVALLTRWGMPRPGSPPAPPPGSETVPTTPPAAAPKPPHGEQDLSAVLYAAAVGFLALVAAGSAATARRTRRSASRSDPGPDAEPAAPPAIAAESLARAAEVGLAEVGDPNREPRAAIIACYAAMERELARVPAAAPRDFDTASEVLARAVEYGALRHDSATQLVELFEEARFSPHVMGEAHRDTAVRVLRLALAELRGGA